MARDNLSALIDTLIVDPSGRRARAKPDATEDSLAVRRVTGGREKRKGQKRKIERKPRAMDYASSVANTALGFTPSSIGRQGFETGQAIGDYARSTTPGDFGETALAVGKALPGAIYDEVRENPGEFLLSLAPGYETVRAIGEGARLRAEGRPEEAFAVERGAGPMEVLNFAPFGVLGAGAKAGARAAVRGGKRMLGRAAPEVVEGGGVISTLRPNERNFAVMDDPYEGEWSLDLSDLGNIPIETISSGPAILSKPKSIEAWHGTPHRFATERRVVTPQGTETFLTGTPDLMPNVPADFSVTANYPLGRFRSEKLGTGEGAQQYGIGAYLAENPDVARNYRSELTQNVADANINGVPLAEYYDALQRRADAARNPEALYDRLSLIEDLGIDLDLHGVQQRAALGAYTPEALEWFNREIAPKYDAPGALYRVRGDIDPREMLSLDDPLAAQSEAVRNAVKNLDLSSIGEGHRNRVMLEQFLAGTEPSYYPATGQTLLSALTDPKSYEHTAEGSRYLLEQGVPGIRYWDEGSREARRGTRNFVVFNPERDLTILERYAVGGRASKAPSLKVKK